MSKNRELTLPMVLFVCLSSFFFLDTADLRTHTFGYSVDILPFVWFLNWWPYALSHHLNPLICHFVWYPSGFNMTWATSVPFLALITWPITALWSPILSYNLLMLAAPALGAYTAYLLIHEVTADLPASLTGGFFFGFCAPTYLEMESGELNLATVFLVPLAVWVCLRLYHGKLRPRGAVIWLTALMLMQLGISTEVLATSCVMGALTWCVFLACMPVVARPALWRIALCVWMAAALAALIAAPFFWELERGLVDVPAQINSVKTASLDPLEYVFPIVKLTVWQDVPASLLHELAGFEPDETAVFGLPLLIIIGLFAAREIGRPFGRAILITTGLMVVASLGPNLHWNGKITSILLPWSLVTPFPLIGAALPVRFDVYAVLGASIIASVWLAASGSRLARFTLTSLACAMLVPKERPVVVAPPWQVQPFLTELPSFSWSPWPRQRFFDNGSAAKILTGRPNVLVLPFGPFGPEMAWQVNSGMAYTQSGGYVGFEPARETEWKVLNDLYLGPPSADFGNQFSSFCKAHTVQYVLVGPGTPPSIAIAIKALNWPGKIVDEMEIMTVPKT